MQKYYYEEGNITSFFRQQHKQNHVDSAKQIGSFASIWTTTDDCFLALRAKLSALKFCVRGTWMSSELWKLAKAGYSSGSETIYTNWEQSVANVTVNCIKSLMHSIPQMKAFISVWSGDWLVLIFLAPIKPSKLSSMLYQGRNWLNGSR